MLRPQALLPLLLAFLLAACGVRQEQHEAVLAENERLRETIQDLTAKMAALKAAPPGSGVVLEDTETRQFQSAVNGQSYLLKVKLPRGYDAESDITYPVLYLTDAETNFGGVSYIVQRLTKDELIPHILVVGVAYGTDYDDFYRQRSRDLTPVEDPNSRVGHGGVPDPTGGAPLFVRVLEEEVFPLVEESYRASAEDRAIYGHSYGGLFGSWVLLHHGDLFQRYLILSPSLWFKDRWLVGEAQTADLPLRPTRVFMASGRLEGRIDDLQEAFADILRRRRPPGLVLHSRVLDDETHRTVFGRGFTDGMRFLYTDQEPPS